MKKVINIDLYKEKDLEKRYEEVLAIVNDDSYKFIIEDMTTVINDRYFSRENKDFKFLLDFIKKEASLLLKENNRLFDIDLEDYSYNRKENSLELEYKISSDEKPFKIIITEKED
jgi:hypothetical protein